MNINDILQNPDEHVRFAAYLDQLGRVADLDEVDLVRRVLTDPDRTMAQSAVLRHLDRRAAGLCPGPAYEGWAQAMTPATNARPFLAQRLREWSLFRAVTLKLPWQPGRPARIIQLAPAQDRRRNEHRGHRDPRRRRPHQADPQHREGHPQPSKRELKNQLTHNS
ncbi:hypothetical protein QFZ63_000090 [Streptomyces sp. B3I7]|uniref:hypothetical protein n=1 Tax=Streptomyces sp. B3I7 TaxID=3042269 RepID=UPI002787FFD8|nr:hypothetical protein [Streptomyces sp. B3I7]MDQ0808376.1 hypothetical protein [Streptomyces sp. B3I7]